MRQLLVAVFGTILLVVGAGSNALNVIDNGRLTEDPTDGLMWSPSGALFPTMQALFSLQGEQPPEDFVKKVIAAAGGSIPVPNSPPGTPPYQLSLADFKTDGPNVIMTWFGAQAFVIYLNGISLSGFSDWRLPVTTDQFSSLGPATPDSSEMAEVFVGQLNISSVNFSQDLPGGYFNALSYGPYWSSPSKLFAGTAWTFTPSQATQWPQMLSTSYASVLVVRTATVPAGDGMSPPCTLGTIYPPCGHEGPPVQYKQ